MKKFAGARPKHCKFCSKQVYFHKDQSGWSVHNLDFSDHLCENLKPAKVKVLRRDQVDPELLKQYEDSINK